VQRTLTIIKPDAVKKNAAASALSLIEKAGLKLIAVKMLYISKDRAKEFYAVHKERPFFDSLTDFMSDGPVVAAVVEGNNAIVRLRELMGPTDPANAEKGTIREAFGSDVEKNAVHGSDSIESAKEEIPFFFSEMEIF